MKADDPMLRDLSTSSNPHADEEHDSETPEEAVGDNLHVAARAATAAGNNAAFAAEALLQFASQARLFSASWSAGRNPNAGSLYLALGEASALLAAVQRDFDTASTTLTALQVQVARADSD